MDANALYMCITGMQAFLHKEMQVDLLVKQLLRLSSQNKHLCGWTSFHKVFHFEI